MIKEKLLIAGVLNQCVGCRRVKFNVRKRSYIVPQVSKFPITSDGKLCWHCFTNIRWMTLKVKPLWITILEKVGIKVL